MLLGPLVGFFPSWGLSAAPAQVNEPLTHIPLGFYVRPADNAFFAYSEYATILFPISVEFTDPLYYNHEKFIEGCWIAQLPCSVESVLFPNLERLNQRIEELRHSIMETYSLPHNLTMPYFPDEPGPQSSFVIELVNHLILFVWLKKFVWWITVLMFLWLMRSQIIIYMRVTTHQTSKI